MDEQGRKQSCGFSFRRQPNKKNRKEIRISGLSLGENRSALRESAVIVAVSVALGRVAVTVRAGVPSATAASSLPMLDLW
jgi:hypothetical protein